MTAPAWYTIRNIDQLDSPALAIYKDRVAENITRLINSIDDVTRLRPHVKTHKSAEVTAMMLVAGIKKFKCATIAEAEMLAGANAPDVLLAYQPVGPKANRLAVLRQAFPQTRFACLVDNEASAEHLASVFTNQAQPLEVYIDLNVGMNRTGVLPEKAEALWNYCQTLRSLNVVGLHVYDGHLRDTDYVIRKKRCDEGFERVQVLKDRIAEQTGQHLTIVAGGTPTYSIHCKRNDIECSPGTFIYWDKGYEQILPEQHYQHAAVVITRVISKPAAELICIDLGHKAIAAENPLHHRVYFLNAPDLEPVGHSEEHMVLKTTAPGQFNVGDVLYGIPYHVCPTIALHDRTAVIQDNSIAGYWNTRSRNRQLTF